MTTEPERGLRQVDLNADLGESFGPWRMGQDDEILPVITSANVACGLHAGDWDVMAETMRTALRHGTGIGAHPGYPDLQGFGRRRMQIPAESLRNLVAYQLGAAQAMARMAGGELRHLKLHGALANTCAEDPALARAAFEGALSVDPGIILVVLAATAQQEAAETLDCRWAGEIFADRAYNDDATLVDRSLPGAVIHDPALAARRVVEMVQAGAIITQDGRHLRAPTDTICLHGDGPQALAIARAVRAGLEAAGIALAAFTGRQGRFLAR